MGKYDQCMNLPFKKTSGGVQYLHLHHILIGFFHQKGVIRHQLSPAWQGCGFLSRGFVHFLRHRGTEDVFACLTGKQLSELVNWPAAGATISTEIQVFCRLRAILL